MMDEQLSALLDGELEADATHDCLNRLSHDATLRQTWSRQHLLRALLKEQTDIHTDLAGRVMAALDAGMTRSPGTADRRARIFSFPLPPGRRTQWAAGLALAASVAAVALLIPVATFDESHTGADGSRVAETTTPQARQVAGVRRQRANEEASRELQEYLLTHETLAAGHGLGSQRSYMRMASPGTAFVAYSPE